MTVRHYPRVAGAGTKPGDSESALSELTVVVGVDFQGGRPGATFEDLSHHFPPSGFRFRVITPIGKEGWIGGVALRESADEVLAMRARQYIVIGYCAGARIAGGVACILQRFADVRLVVMIDPEDTGVGDLRYAAQKALAERTNVRFCTDFGKPEGWQLTVDRVCRAIAEAQRAEVEDPSWADLIQEFVGRYRSWLEYLAVAAAVEPSVLRCPILQILSRRDFERLEWPARRHELRFVLSDTEHAVLSRERTAREILDVLATLADCAGQPGGRLH